MSNGTVRNGKVTPDLRKLLGELDSADEVRIAVYVTPSSMDKDSSEYRLLSDCLDEWGAAQWVRENFKFQGDSWKVSNRRFQVSLTKDRIEFLDLQDYVARMTPVTNKYKFY